ncbi:unnamed protein product [Gongylonema pulchrum]|uniref:Poly(ADP-ribose) glycohydrolase n=1 Tax=Gongylonema pulchrum TaxID=637853 RepID=A0A183DXC3_9BILA|nr:unnamed protein product [Gongylonema pulchrum]
MLKKFLVSISFLSPFNKDAITAYPATTLCAYTVAASFDELSSYLSPNLNPNELATLYEHVDDVDLVVGVLAERPTRGSLVGDVTGCIIGSQFQKTRNADRFWFENYFAPSAFTEEHLSAIRKTTLAGILCSTTGLITIQPNVFMVSDHYE